MDEVIRTTDEHAEDDDLGPTERRRAVAKILACGIRRLLTHPGPAAPRAPVPCSSESSGRLSEPTGKPERVALPVAASRAVMAHTKAG